MIIVDTMASCKPNKYWKHKTSCHLTSLYEDDLKRFAKKLPRKGRRFHRGNFPHYDLTAELRDKAIALGAKPISRRVMVRWRKLIVANNTSPAVFDATLRAMLIGNAMREL